MGLLSAFPPAPLTHADTVRIRSREDVTEFTTVGSTTIDGLRSHGRERATRAVALVNRTVCAFEFGETGWTERLLRRDADRQAHLEATLDWM